MACESLTQALAIMERAAADATGSAATIIQSEIRQAEAERRALHVLDDANVARVLKQYGALIRRFREANATRAA